MKTYGTGKDLGEWDESLMCIKKTKQIKKDH